jgi:3-phenylpropionate/trans-cinnamate dioxygenase ferredoxin reductase subunit
MTTEQTYIIVGAGFAGAKAAESLRTRGAQGRIVLVGAEPVRPYERPPLSKGYLIGSAGLDKVFVHDEGYYQANDIELLTSSTVSGIDPGRRVVTLADGRDLAFDRLLLATGSEPRRLTVPGADLDGVHYLRTLADADRLIAAAGAAGSVAVIGAGWIGAEAAASLRERGLPVTLIEPTGTPLERVLGPEVGGVYRDLHAERGVTLCLGEGVESLHGGDDGRVRQVRTSTGRQVDADLVVVGIGAAPRVELAAEAGLAVSNGVVVDEFLRTSHPDIWAAGDIAAAWHPLYGTHVRVEHWANALHQGPTAAASMLGDAPEPYTRLPYFFSDQYDLGMEYTGYCPRWDEVVFRGEPAGREFIAFWLRDGVVAAAMNAGIWDVQEHLQRLVRDKARIEPKRLADPDTPLAELVG